MRIVKAFVIAAAVSAALGSLGGCVTLLPKQKPVQLYRFSYDPASLGKNPGEVSQTSLAATPTQLALGTVQFPQEASGDRVLTTENNQLSYIADSRWAVPAAVLFNEALSDGFARAGHGLQLEARGPGAASFRLDLIVRKFETHYHRGKAMVTVDMDARLIRISDHAIVGERFVNADVGVEHNNMNEMVEAYDRAMTQTVMALIDFTQESLASANDAVPMPTPGQVPVAK